MRLRRTLLALALAAMPFGAATAHAQTAPPNPGDFAISIVPGGAGPTGAMPNCTPGLETLGALFMSGQTSVTADCNDASSAKGAASTGTASNPTLAASTGDAGFNSGSITMVCDTNQKTLMRLLITPTSSTMERFGGTIFQACSFSMAFQDAKRSTLVGTVEVNGTLGSADQTVVNNVVDITILAKTYVTSGTGAFAGYTGTGAFSQTQQINVNPAQGGGGGAPSGGSNPYAAFCTANGIADCSQTGIQTWCMTPANAAACASLPRSTRQAATGTSTMKLRLVKAAGAVRILSPAAPAGRPKAAAKVKATTKIKVTATKGANCSVVGSNGKTIGKGTVKGKYGAATITPKAGAYKGLSWIQATCLTKTAKKPFTSNRVRVALS